MLLLALPLGWLAGELFAAIGRPVFGAAPFLGAALAILLAPALVDRALGLTGSLRGAAFLVAVAGVLRRIAPADHAEPDARRDAPILPSLLVAIALGLGGGVHAQRVDAALGGTELAASFGALSLVLALGAGRLLRRHVPRGIGCALAAIALWLASGNPPGESTLVACAQHVAASMTGDSPLPLLQLGGAGWFWLFLPCAAALGIEACAGSLRAAGAAVATGAAVQAAGLAPAAESSATAVAALCALAGSLLLLAPRAPIRLRRLVAPIAGVLLLATAGPRLAALRAEPEAAPAIHEEGGPVETRWPPRVVAPGAVLDRIGAAVLVHTAPSLEIAVLGQDGAPLACALARMQSGRVTLVTPDRDDRDGARAEIERRGLRGRVEAVLAWPRAFLAADPRRFDAIFVLPPLQPIRATGRLLTLEFADLLRRRLREDGAAAVLLPLAALQPRNLVARLLPALSRLAPESALFLDHPRAFPTLAAWLFRREPAPPRLDRVAERLAELQRAAPGSGIAGTDYDVRTWLQCCVAGAAVLKLDPGPREPNRDERPQLATALDAAVIPDPEHACLDLQGLMQRRSFAGDRVSLPPLAPGMRAALLEQFRRDFEATGRCFAAGSVGQGASDPAAPIAAGEIETLLVDFGIAPSLALVRGPLLRHLDALESTDAPAALEFAARLAEIEGDSREPFLRARPQRRAEILMRVAALQWRLLQPRAAEATLRRAGDDASAPLARILAGRGAVERAEAAHLLETSGADAPRDRLLRAFLEGDRASASAALLELDAAARDDALVRWIAEWSRSR